MRALPCLLLLLPLLCRSEDVPIRIVKAKSPYKAYTPEPPEPVASRPPGPFAGPPVFAALQGRCWTTTSGGYEYKLCPYANVTQKAVGRSHTSFYGLLGCVRASASRCPRPPARHPAPARPRSIWDSWKVVDGKYTAQQYTDGLACPGNKKRKTEVCGIRQCERACGPPRVCACVCMWGRCPGGDEVRQRGRVQHHRGGGARDVRIPDVNHVSRGVWGPVPRPLPSTGRGGHTTGWGRR